MASYGSRATGTYKPISDINIVIYSNLDAVDLAWFREALAESSLSLNTDLQLYLSLASQTFRAIRASIDRQAQELFNQAELLAQAA